jgi:arylsulfatase A-like enzyme
MRLPLGFLVLTFATSVLGGEGRPNFLVLVADDLRPDGIAALGNPNLRTPHLDALAARSLVFTRAYCSYPICVVSRAEMLTGRQGWENGIDGMAGRTFREGQVYWAEALREAGYETWHVGKWHVPGRPSQRGYDEVAGMFGSGGGRLWKEGQVDRRGFPITGYTGWIFQSEDGGTQFPELGVGLAPETNEHFADAALSLIRRGGEKPWFCHVNFTAPHDPLLPSEEGVTRLRGEAIPPPPDFLPQHPFDHGNLEGRDERLLPWPRTEEAVRELRRDYYAVVEDLDRAVGRILAGLEEGGHLESTVVLFTSDHGLALGSHGLTGKQNQYEHTARVPLLVSGPGIGRGTTDAMVYLRELFPTTCELGGAAVPDSVTGNSFASVLRGERADHHEIVFGYFADSQRMVRTADGWKLVRYPKIDRWQLFDLNADPLERNDLVGEAASRPRFEELRGLLEEWRRATGDPLPAE